MVIMKKRTSASDSDSDSVKMVREFYSSINYVMVIMNRTGENVLFLVVMVKTEVMVNRNGEITCFLAQW